MKVQEFLTERQVPFATLEHPQTYDAQSLAHAVHVSGERVAKTVLLKADDGWVLAVLPATHVVDLRLARTVLGAHSVRLATEPEVGQHFPDCELGALPPFGSQYGMRTLLDPSLLGEHDLVFEGNTHHQAFRMSEEDFRALEQPQVAEFSHHL